MWLEIFKSGSHKDTSGTSSNWDAESLDKIVNIYNRRISEDKSYQAPVVKGHPQTNDPAFGWVERLARRGNKIVALLKNLDENFIDEVRTGRFKKVSIALYPDLLLRHVGFLGAAAPAVKGLNTAQFADQVAEQEIVSDIIEFAEEICNNDENLSNDTSNSNPEPTSEGTFSFNDLVARIKELEAENQKQSERITNSEKEARLSEFREFTESLINHSDGAIIIPSQAETLIDILEMAFQSDVRDRQGASFSENESNVEKIKHFVSSLQPVLTLTEFAMKGKSQTITSEADFSGRNVQQDKLEIHRRAKQYQADNPGFSYEEALCVAQKSYEL